MKATKRIIVLGLLLLGMSSSFARMATCADIDEALGEAYMNLDLGAYAILLEIACDMGCY